MKKRAIRFLCLILALACLLPTGLLSAAAEEASVSRGYYYDQLLTAGSKAVYEALGAMNLKSGTAVTDLTDIFTVNTAKDIIMADFTAGRDAFMLDNSHLFYVEFDKMSVTHTGSQILMGIGREDTYLADGFAAADVDAAVAAFNGVVAEIAAAANTAAESVDDTLKLQTKVRAAYDGVMGKVEYALEADADPANVLYVRDPYGALVRGEAVCEGYARGLKAVLDALNVENVLVQGMYVDGKKLQPHMWNYVRMDDNRWYLLDATMGDAATDSGKFFLKGGLDDLLEYYQPDGVISLAQNSKEFFYPDLSIASYEPLSTAFSVTTTEDGKKMISYKGMGIRKTRTEKKLYILASFNGSTWFYYEDYLYASFAAMGTEDLDGAMESMDWETGFSNAFQLAYFAVTEHPNPNSDKVAPTHEKAVYQSSMADITDQSLVGEITEMSKTPPSIVERTPAASRLRGGKKYTISVTYSEELKKVNEAQGVGIQWVREVAGATLKNFQWKDTDKRTVTFELTTSANFGFTTLYYFELTNLVGKVSNEAPATICYHVANVPSFTCPKVPGGINNIHSNTPALIADGDLAANGWQDADGKPVGENLPNRLALVATTVTDDTTNVNKIKETLGEASVKASQTFDLSLSLCSAQVAYITGKPVKVFIPYPESYNYENLTGTTFKAYHFDKNGSPEEVDCVAVEAGLILYCEAFSPYTIVALSSEEVPVTEKKVLLTASGKGYFDVAGDLVTLNSGETRTVTVVAEAGHVIQSITLDGKDVVFTNNQMAKVELSAANSTLEATFVTSDLGEGFEANVNRDEQNIPPKPDQSGDYLTVNDLKGTEKILIVAYTAQGQMTEMQMVDAKTGDNRVKITVAGAQIRAFVVNGTTYEPLRSAIVWR